MSVPLTDEEEEEPAPPPKVVARKRKAEVSSSATSSAPRAMQLTDTQLHHLLLAKSMCAVTHMEVIRRVQRRLSSALQAPTLSSSGRVKVILDFFQEAVIRSRLPLLKEVAGSTANSVTWVGETTESFLPVCQFPFHALGYREGKIFKPKKVKEGRAICYYTPPMQFHLRRQKICGVTETKLTVTAQIAMLNHANVLTVATASPDQLKKQRGAFGGYSEEQRVDIKARGVVLLQQFLADPANARIPLSNGLQRVAHGTADNASEVSVTASEMEAENLEPVPLPGCAVDTFSDEGETYE